MAKTGHDSMGWLPTETFRADQLKGGVDRKVAQISPAMRDCIAGLQPADATTEQRAAEFEIR